MNPIPFADLEETGWGGELSWPDQLPQLCEDYGLVGEGTSQLQAGEWGHNKKFLQMQTYIHTYTCTVYTMSCIISLPLLSTLLSLFHFLSLVELMSLSLYYAINSLSLSLVIILFLILHLSWSLPPLHVHASVFFSWIQEVDAITPEQLSRILFHAFPAYQPVSKRHDSSCRQSASQIITAVMPTYIHDHSTGICIPPVRVQCTCKRKYLYCIYILVITLVSIHFLSPLFSFFSWLFVSP